MTEKTKKISFNATSEAINNIEKIKQYNKEITGISLTTTQAIECALKLYESYERHKKHLNFH